jgi:hypothetical protein
LHDQVVWEPKGVESNRFSALRHCQDVSPASGRPTCLIFHRGQEQSDPEWSAVIRSRHALTHLLSRPTKTLVRPFFRRDRHDRQQRPSYRPILS